jgi:hypothetical protein
LKNGQITQLEEDLLIREWQTIIQYWAADNSVALTWSTLFMLINSILFALLAVAPSDSIVPSWVLKYVGPSLAIAMNIIWGAVITRMVVYIQHCHDLVMDIQKQVPVLRFQNSDLLQFRWYQRLSTKTLLQYIPILFCIVWIVILIALVN